MCEANEMNYFGHLICDEISDVSPTSYLLPSAWNVTSVFRRGTSEKKPRKLLHN